MEAGKTQSSEWHLSTLLSLSVTEHRQVGITPRMQRAKGGATTPGRSGSCSDESEIPFGKDTGKVGDVVLQNYIKQKRLNQIDIINSGRQGLTMAKTASVLMIFKLIQL